MKKVGVIGCGLMGRGIIKNLIKNNYDVIVFDVDQEAVKKVEQLGAKAAENLTTIAQEVNYLILSLPSPEIVEKTLTDERVIEKMRPGAKIMDMSTNDVELTKKLHDYAETFGVDFLDCPVSGGPDGAENGTLTVMVGGKDQAFPYALPVLEAVGKHIEFIGPSGTGQTVKLCNNMVVGGVITLLSEALLSGEKAGVPMEKMVSIFQKGSANTRVMDVFGPNILNQTFEEVKFSLANMYKDIDLYRNLAEVVHTPTFASSITHQLYQLAKYKGEGENDATAVFNVLEGMGKSSLPH